MLRNPLLPRWKLYSRAWQSFFPEEISKSWNFLREDEWDRRGGFPRGLEGKSQVGKWNRTGREVSHLPPIYHPLRLDKK